MNFCEFWLIFCGFYLCLSSLETLAKVTGKIKHGRTWKTMDGKPTKFFAHRGEMALLPEHTVPAYKIATILGADFIEPDLCLTKDDQFVCHHDLFLKDGTDVEDHPEFDHLKKNMSDGSYNWYIRDFTLIELKTLKVKQRRMGVRPQDFNGIFMIPTLQEFLQVVAEMSVKLNKTFGISPELKDPSYHNQGKSSHFMEHLFLESLSRNGFPDNCSVENVGNVKCPQVIIQSFERSALEYLKSHSNFELLMLADDDLTLLTHKGIAQVGKFANYYCVWKEYLNVEVETYLKFIRKPWDPIQIESLGGFVNAQDFPQIAHQNGMKMVVYTVYDSREPSRRDCAIYGQGPRCDQVRNDDKRVELNSLFELGVDGIFIENIAEGREIRREFELTQIKSDGPIFERPSYNVLLILILTSQLFQLIFK